MNQTNNISIEGVSAVITHGGKFLLQLRDNKPDIADPNMWGFVGGGIEEGEDPQTAMQRECVEEIGFIPENIKFAGKTVDSKYIFFANLHEDELDKIRLGEGQELRFFDLSEIPVERCIPRIRIFFTQYKDIAEHLARGEFIDSAEMERLGLKTENQNENLSDVRFV